MQTYQMTLKPQTAFATPLHGDTLFGSLCWALRNRLGEGLLTDLLQGYTEQRPFAVLSDAFPEGYLPLPKLPGRFYRQVENADRKVIKKRNWLPSEAFEQPVPEWLQLAQTSAEVAACWDDKIQYPFSETHAQPHNSINRLTGTTGDGFAPYSMPQDWYHPGLRWHCYLQLDESRIDPSAIRQCLEDIGLVGYGRDASIGMGKFIIQSFDAVSLPAQPGANACLTLACCMPQGLGYRPEKSFYQTFTRFGRHGDQAVHSGRPFKNPLLMAQAGALFSLQPPVAGFIGQGIGGNGELSKSMPETVHQGYAPVIAVHLPEKE